MIRLVSPGIATSVQDGGRCGRAHLGRGRGGAADVWSLALANRLVGNDEGAAAWETSGLLAFALDAPAMVAITGAMVDVAVQDGPPLGWGAPTPLPAGATVRLGPVRDGLRTYVAFRGGLVRSVSDELTVGPDPGTPAASEPAAHRPPAAEIAVWPGPRLDWFDESAWTSFVRERWVVTPDSNRIGVRLAGPVLGRARGGELLSEGLIEGAVQVPPDGQPIVMLADHPTTGGYPVIAVVDPRDVRHVAQAAPGTALRFRAAS